MAEAGIDMSNRHSKTLEQLPTLNFDCVITVCNHANEHCPVFPLATTTLHQNFDDPPALSRNAASEEEALQHYRRVRDEIDNFIQTLPDKLDSITSRAHQ